MISVSFRLTFLSLAFSCSFASACWVNSSWLWRNWFSRTPEDKVWRLRNCWWCCCCCSWYCCWCCKDTRGFWNDRQKKLLAVLATRNRLILFELKYNLGLCLDHRFIIFIILKRICRSWNLFYLNFWLNIKWPKMALTRISSIERNHIIFTFYGEFDNFLKTIEN